MEPAFLAPLVLPSTSSGLARFHTRPRTRRNASLCATMASGPGAGASTGPGDIIGPHRKPRDVPSDTVERDVVEALRPSRAEIRDAQRLQFRQASVAQKRARQRKVTLTAPPVADDKDIAIEKVKEPPLAAAMAEMSAEEITSAWTKRGNSNSVLRTVEIWWFFFRMVTGELKIRKIEDKALQSEARRKHAVELKKGLLILGPTFIKLGQLMSTRVDIVAKEYIDELTSLQDRVPGFTGEHAIEVIEADLGKPILEVFDSFDPTPIAAASLGQVHRAVYKGRDVAIKVQRDGLQELFDVDLKNFKTLAGLLDKFDPKNDGASRNWVQIFEESAKLLYEEIDYVHEGENADRFRRNFEGTPWVKVPRVYWDVTTSRVLTLEYVPGIKINDYEALERAGIDRKLLAKRSAESYLTQLLRHGYFHTDPHCGNLAVDSVAGGRLIYYDFGMMSTFQPSIKKGLVDVIFGIYEGSSKDICDAMTEMGVLARGADRITVEKVGRYFLGLFRTNLEQGNRKKDKSERRAEMSNRMGSIGEELLAVSEDECFNFPPVFTFVFRSFTTLEGIGKGLYPKYDLTLIAGPYLKELIDLKDGSATKTAMKSFRKRVGWRAQDINAVISQPRKTAYIENTLRRMETGDLRLRVRVLESERAFKKITIVQQNIALSILASTFVNMAVILSTAGSKFILQARLCWVLAAVAAVKLLIGIFKQRSVEKRLNKYTRASF